VDKSSKWRNQTREMKTITNALVREAGEKSGHLGEKRLTKRIQWNSSCNPQSQNTKNQITSATGKEKASRTCPRGRGKKDKYERAPTPKDSTAAGLAPLVLRDSVDVRLRKRKKRVQPGKYAESWGKEEEFQKPGSRRKDAFARMTRPS